MSVQVNYISKIKGKLSSNIALFADEEFKIKNLNNFFSKNEASYIEKILKNKKNNKETIISFNINENSSVILISVKKDLKGSDVENLGAQFYTFVKKNKIQK